MSPSFALEEPKGSSVYIQEPVFNYGIIQRGEIVEHQFQIENQGNELLIIEDIQPTCGCTTTTIAPFEIAAGETMEIDTHYDSSGKTGKIRQAINMTTNDPENPRVTLFIEGEIHASVEVAPSILYFEKSKQEQHYEQSFRVMGLTAKPVRVLEAKSNLPSVDIHIGKYDALTNSTQITARLLGTAPFEKLRGWIRVLTDEALDPHYEVRIISDIPSTQES